MLLRRKEHKKYSKESPEQVLLPGSYQETGLGEKYSDMVVHRWYNQCKTQTILRELIFQLKDSTFCFSYSTASNVFLNYHRHFKE